MKKKLYAIEGKTYLDHINDEVHLYGLLHQLAFLAGRIKDEQDVVHVLDTAKRYGEIAEEKFPWRTASVLRADFIQQRDFLRIQRR